MTTVKIAFLLDCTASMGSWIHTAKTKILEIVGNIRNEHNDIDIQVGLIGYRDYDDEERFIVRDFTSPDVIRAALSRITADGGDDEAEDVAHALQQCSALSWGDADVRMIFHITDAPAHGLAFHKLSVSDRFPQGDPEGLDPRVLMRMLSTRGFTYTFVKITSATDTMLDEFYNSWTGPGVFQILDLRPQRMIGNESVDDAFSQEVSRAVSCAIDPRTFSTDT